MADMIKLDTNSSYKNERQKPTAIAIDITVIRPLQEQYRSSLSIPIDVKNVCVVYRCSQPMLA